MKKIILTGLALCTILSMFSCEEKECSHNHLTSELVAATCETEGYTLNTCVECKEEFKTKYILPTGHTMVETAVDPTCTEEGYKNFACSCGYSYKSSNLPPLGHTYVSKEVGSSCEDAGYIEHVCSVCENTYKSDFKDALGHKMKKEVIAPTPDEPGCTKYSCEVCEKTYVDEITFYSDMYGTGATEGVSVLCQGIDVSVYQHLKNSDDTYRPLDWVALKEAGVDYAILKAGSGNGIDPVFEMNYEDAKAAGMPLGAYFYTYAKTEEELLAEIQLLLSWLDGKQFEYPIYFDLEDKTLENAENKEMLTKFCITFIDKLRENGYYAALYSNKTWLSDYLYGDLLKGYCDIWYARYPHMNDVTLNDSFSWDMEKYGYQLGMWQYSSCGYISDCGMPKNQAVDLNYCYKDYPYIIKKYGFNGFEGELNQNT